MVSRLRSSLQAVKRGDTAVWQLMVSQLLGAVNALAVIGWLAVDKEYQRDAQLGALAY